GRLLRPLGGELQIGFDAGFDRHGLASVEIPEDGAADAAAQLDPVSGLPPDHVVPARGIGEEPEAPVVEMEDAVPKVVETDSETLLPSHDPDERTDFQNSQQLNSEIYQTSRSGGDGRASWICHICKK